MNNTEKFIIARWAYAIGKDYISDVEYDRLEQEMKSNNLLSEYTSRGWSEDPCPYELLKKHNLDDFIMAAVYTHSTESIESLNSDILVKEKLSNLKTRTRVSYKLDGWSLRLNYYNGILIFASLRNRNSGKSVDLTSIVKLFKQEIDLTGKVLITGELYLKNNRLEEYKRLRGIVSQRNGVSTAIANGDIEFLGYKCYSIYSDLLQNSEEEDKYITLQKLGFSVSKNIVVTDYLGLLKAIKILGMQKSNYDAPTDGLVLENESSQYALRVGEWEEACNNSYITGYVFNRGMYGNSVLCSIKPIFVNNKTVSEIDVTNIQTIIDNNLRIGYPIAFVERSAVNSILDTIKTKEIQDEYVGRYEEYRNEIDSKI